MKQNTLSEIWKRFTRKLRRIGLEKPIDAAQPANDDVSPPKATPDSDVSEKETVSILIVASGGARGLAAWQPLKEIEKRTGKSIAENFDIISGASTGAIIAKILTIEDPGNPGTPLFSAADGEKFYLEWLPKIFDPEGYKRHRRYRSIVMDSTYDGKALDEALDIHLGDTTVEDTLVITITPAADIRNNQPVWVTSIDEDIKKHMKQSDLTRAVVSAPSFLKTKRIEVRNPDDPKTAERFDFVDGFFFSGMLPLYAYDLAKKLAPDKRITVTFIGTGRMKFSFTADSWNKLKMIDFVSDKHGHPILNMLTDMHTQAALDMLRERLGEDFYAFNKDIDPKNPHPDDPSYTLDDATPANLPRLQKLGRATYEENPHELDRLCEDLTTRIPPTGLPGIKVKRRKKEQPKVPAAAPPVLKIA